MWRSILIAALLCTTPALANDTLTNCDRLASHPEDPDRVGPAIETKNLQFDKSVAACEADLKADPSNARLHYLLGRLYFYNNQNEKAVAEVRLAADKGYRQAQFVFGAFINNKRAFAPTDMCLVEQYWLKSAQAGRQAARISYVRHAVKGKFAGCKVQLNAEQMQALLDQVGKDAPNYYERLLIEDLSEALKTYSPS
jgi:TPR repeat protein